MVSVTGATSPAMPRAPPTTSSRDEFWSEDATFTLIEAWGERYLDLNRGSLRQNHWKDVAGAVNGRYENDAGGKPHRTDVQCKNRIDTLKKKYKIERARVSESNGTYNSPWPFFSALDGLLNPTNPASKTPDPSSETAKHRDLTAPAMVMTPFPVAPRSAITRRPAPFLPLPFLSGNEPSGFHGNLSAFATAAAAAAASEEEESKSNVKKRRRRESCEELAEAIEKLGHIYERVEERKRKQTVELEKQRMKFAKELECHRMRLFTEMQVKIHKMNSSGRAGKRSSSSAAAAAAIAAGETLFPVFHSGN